MKLNFWPYVLEKGKGSECYEQPFTLVDNQKAVWNIACDRVWVVAVRGKTCFPRFQGGAGDYNVILSLVQSIPVEPRWITEGKLKEWVQASTAKAEIKLGQIFGFYVDLVRVAKLLDTCQTGGFKVWDSSALAHNACLGLADKDERLRLFLMGCATEVEERIGAPVLDVSDVPEAPLDEQDIERTIFDMAMHGG